MQCIYIYVKQFKQTKLERKYFANENEFKCEVFLCMGQRAIKVALLHSIQSFSLKKLTEKKKMYQTFLRLVCTLLKFQNPVRKI